MSQKIVTGFSVTLATALVVTLWHCWPGTVAPPPAATPPLPAATVAQSAPAPVVAAALVSAAPHAEGGTPAPKGSVLYPDGSSQPALNRVVGEVRLNWGVGPFTRVVGVEDGPGGWQWYVHENGARSTTAMVDLNGVPQAMGFVAEPHQTLPVFDGAFRNQLQRQLEASGRGPSVTGSPR